MIPFIYTPPPTTRIKVDIVFPWDKEYNVKEISLKDYQDHFLGVTKMIDEEKKEC